MATAQRDPFSWADNFARQQHETARQESGQAQNALMTVFQEEARRQRPWSDLPADLARSFAVSDHNLGNQMQLATHNSNLTMQRGAATARAKNLTMPPNKVANTITAAAKTYGMDPDIMLTIADIETGGRFNADAKNPHSSASGIFQFTSGTARQYGLADPFDVTASSAAAARLARDNANALQRAGIPVNAGTLYLAHQQGAGGAIKLLANPNARAIDVVGVQEVRRNGGRLNMTAGQFARLWTDRADRIYKQRQSARQKSQPKYIYAGEEFTLDSDEES